MNLGVFGMEFISNIPKHSSKQIKIIKIKTIIAHKHLLLKGLVKKKS